VFQFFSKLLWLPRYLENGQNKTTMHFLVSNPKMNILTNQGCNQGKLEKSETIKIFVDAGVSF